MTTRTNRAAVILVRLVLLMGLSLLALQLYFFCSIAFMRLIAPQSTAFQRAQLFKIVNRGEGFVWQQDWVSGAQINNHLRRAVISSEDADFAFHEGVEWEAIGLARKRNARALERFETQIARNPRAKSKQPKIVGGSTITQQLAKNLFLSGERSYPRKAQEIALAYMLESLLDKNQILDIYLNSVEWGEGVFGAQAASLHYFQIEAAQLNSAQAARLAVMLPAPRSFEKKNKSPYLQRRTRTIQTRMQDADLP